MNPDCDHPHSRFDLFFSFTILAMQGFGGVLTVAQRVLVDEKKWLTNEGFVEEWAVAQVLPGPNVINLAIMLGVRYFGFTGAVAAVLGLLMMPAIAVLIIASLFAQVADHPMVQGALRGMGAVAAGLIAGVGIKLMVALKSNPMGLGVCLLFASVAFVAVAIYRLPLIGALLIFGSLAFLWGRHCLIQQQKE
ncbi:MAG: chromate transporter [Limnohabitans sp.]|nr:chromate transporter [Limnohabitans sp.]